METLEKSKAFLSNLSAPNFLIWFKKFKTDLKKPPFRNAGKGTFSDILKEIGSNYAAFEKNIFILEATEEKINDLAITGKRSDIIALYKKYATETTIKATDDLTKNKILAQRTLIGIVIGICEKFNYGIKAGSGKLFPDAILNSEDTFRYRYYYWHENAKKTVRKVKTGSFNFTYTLENENKYTVKSAEMELYPEKKGEPVTLRYTSEEITKEADVLHFHLMDVGLESIKSHVTLYVGRYNPAEWKILTGTFTTVSKSNADTPMAGVIVIKRLEDNEEAPDAQEDPHSIPPEIHSYLHRKRLTAYKDVFPDVHHLPSADEIKKLHKYVGQYQGTYFRKEKRRAQGEGDRVEKFFFEIYPNGETRMIVPNVNEEYIGRTRILGSQSNALISYLDFLPEENTYRFTIYFNNELIENENKKNLKNTLYAVYAGMEKLTSNSPTAGRMIFRKLPVTSQKIEPFHYVKEISISAFLSDTLNAKEINVLSGYAGEPHNYVESLPDNKELFVAKKSLPFSGTFYCYYLSTMQSNIYKVPINFNSDGSVEMKTREKLSKAVHLGIAIYNQGNRLSIYFKNMLRTDAYFHMLFSLGNMGHSGMHHFFGVSSKIDSHGNPSGRVEVLVREDFDFLTSHTKTFRVGTKEYLDEDTRNNNLLTYLTGKDNRFIVAKSAPNDDFTKKNNSVYFAAACYTCQNADTPAERELGVKYFYQAYLHGFGFATGDLKKLKEELGKSFLNFGNYARKVKPDHSDLDSLTFAEIAELIKAREIDPYLLTV